MDDPLAELDSLISAVDEERKVKAQKEACDNILEWLGKHWALLLDDNAQLSDEVHPADALLPVCLELFDKCKDARTAAQQELPMKMTRAVLFGVSHDQKEPLLKFDKDVMQNCFECATGMLSGPQTQMAGAGLLSEVLEVPGYRELADLNRLVKVADQCLEMSFELASRSSFDNDSKRLAWILLGIVEVVMRELCRDSGAKCKCGKDDVENFAKHFIDIGVQVQNHRDLDPMIVVSYMKALTEFHATYALDYRTSAIKIRATVIEIIPLYWKVGGMDQMKRTFVQYLRLLVRARMLTDAVHLERLVSLMKSDVAKGTKGNDEKRGLLTYDETITVELLVDLIYLRGAKDAKDEGLSAETDMGSSSTGRPAKRQKYTACSEDLAWLVAPERMFPASSTGSHPRWYMQILFLHLVKFPEEIPQEERTNLVRKFARAFEQRSFDDLDMIWAMRCLDELVVVNQPHSEAKDQSDWLRIFSSVLNVVSGRRSKRMESFEAIALNLLASLVSEGAVAAKDVGASANMGMIWKLLVTNWGQWVEAQARGSGSVSSSMQASQARENNAGRPAQDPLQVEMALTAFLVAVLNRISLSDESISVEGITCCRRNLLIILRGKLEERGQNAAGHQSVTRLKLIARLVIATVGSGQGDQGQYEGSPLSCCAWNLRDLASESRRTGSDVFKDLNGEYVDIYSQVRGRSGPDFRLLEDKSQLDSIATRYCKIASTGHLQVSRFERSLHSIASVTGWSNQMVSAADLRNQGIRWMVHVQTPHEEVRQLSTMCLEILRRFDAQDIPSSAVAPQMIFAVSLLDLATSTPATDKEWISKILDYLLHDETSCLLDKTQKILSNLSAVRIGEKLAIFESLEDMVDSLLRVLTRQSSADQLGVACDKIHDVLSLLRRHCEQEQSGRGSDNQHGAAMDEDDDFGVKKHEQQAMLAYCSLRFRMWVKISAAAEDTHEPCQEEVKAWFDKSHHLDEILKGFNVLCNFGVPQTGHWSYATDIIKLAAKSISKQEREISRPDRELLYLRIASFLVKRLDLPDLKMQPARKRVLLESIQKDVLKWQVDQSYIDADLRKKSIAKAHRQLRQMYVICAAHVAPLAVTVYGKKESRALGEFISACLTDCAFEVRFEAAKGLGSVIRAFAKGDNNVAIFKDVLEKLSCLDTMYTHKLLSSEANLRSKCLVFGEIAALDDEYAGTNVQAYCVTMLCVFFANNAQSRDTQAVICDMLGTIARRQGFSDKTELVRAHISSILCEWWSRFLEKEGPSWTEFPSQLAGYTDEKLFVENCVAPALVPEILLRLEGTDRDRELEQIGQELSLRDSSANAVVAKFYAHVYSRVVPMAYEPRKVDAAQEQLLQRAFDYIRGSCAEARRATPSLQVTLRLLDVILSGNPTRWDPQNEGTHWTTPQIAEIVIEALKSLATGKSARECELFFLGISSKKKAAPLSGDSQSMSLAAGGGAAPEQVPTDFLPQVYLHLLRALKGQGGRKVTRQQKARVLEAVAAVTTCLGSLLRENVDSFPWVLSHTISHLLTAICDSDVTRQGCQILKTVIDGLIGAKKSLHLVDVLGDIICTLIPLAAQGEFSAGGSENLPLTIIERLVEDVAGTPAGEHRIRGLPPFPQSNIFSHVRALVGKVAGPDDSQSKINVFLQVFEDLKEPVPFEVQKATLVHLHEQLREHFAESSAAAVEPENGRARLVDACIYKMLAWTKMADSYAEKDRHDIRGLIGKCLGQLGPTLTKALSLHAPIERVVAWDGLRKKQRADEFCKNLVKRYRIEMCATIVQKLRSYLEESHVEVVEEAVKLLKCVFTLPERNDILEALKARQDDTLEAANRSRGGKRGARGGAAAADTFDDIATYLQPFLHSSKNADAAGGGAGLVPGALRRNKTAAPCSPEEERKRWSTRDGDGRARSYETWLHELSPWMCTSDKDFELWPACARMCRLKTDFAELVFPSLMFSTFYSSFEHENSADVAEVVGDILKDEIFCKENSNLKATRIVLQGLDVLRLVHQTINKHHFTSKEDLVDEIKGWKYSYFFDVPYLDVAQAARRCGAHLSALMYLELNSKAWSSKPDSKVQGNEELLLAYRAVEEPDGLDAFNNWQDFRARFIAWEHHGEFAKTIGVFDNLLHVGASSSGGAAAMGTAMNLCLQRPIGHGLCGALHNIGFSQLSFMAAASFAASGDSGQASTSYDDEVLFESAWRAQAWQQAGVLARPARHGGQLAYHANLFSALKTLASVQNEKTRTYQEVEDVVRHHMAAARSVALADFHNDHNSQSTKHGQSQLVRLQMCEDVECFLQAMVETSRPAHSPSSQGRGAFARGARSGRLQKMRLNWHNSYKHVDYNFALCEPLISVHTILLGISPFPALLDEHLCLAAKISMKQGNLSFARASMQKLQMFAAAHNPGKGLGEPSPWWIRDAKLLWRDDQADKAAHLMQTLDRHLRTGQSSSPQDRMLQSRALAMNAALSSRTESSATVKGMLESCVRLRERLFDEQRSHQYQAAAAKAQLKLAAFNDEMFTHIQSQQLENKEQEELLKQTQRPRAEAQRGGEKLHNSSLQHLNHGYARMREQRATYLKAALEHYMNAIAQDAGEGKCKGAIFRVLHLWFEILDDSTDDGDSKLRQEVSELLKGRFQKTEDLSAFTGVARQVLARLDDNAAEKQHAQGPIRVLLGKLLKQRPHDLLGQTFYIASLPNKGAAAKELIQQLRREPGFAELVDQTEDLKQAYVELAKSEWCRALGHKKTKACPKCAHKGEKADLDKFSINPGRPSRLSQIHWRGRSKVRVLTASAPADGQDEICVASFDKNVEYPGGVTYPKKIVCVATNGCKYTQIVKSEDPRGDVVLSQIFSVVNLHFARDTKCRQRQLELGTYTVVALGGESCVLEFVDNATSLSTILGATSQKQEFDRSLHGRYASQGEWEYSKCFTKLKESYQADSSDEAQLKTFQDVCAHCAPVFRHYFAENTRSAPEWFELRLRYTRSVASSSMAGHIVGLGDRHCSNILIRETGAQRGSLVHIDLGLIFDQARHLPRPEKIPFRLTRDMIDGMGLARTNGVWSRCAEESLRVMRENKFSLLAVVDVLMQDPLESWRMSDRKRKQRSDAVEGDSGSNIDARIIRKTIKDKLEGLSRGELLSVQGQVKHLIREATSEENLSQLFQGWGAWY